MSTFFHLLNQRRNDLGMSFETLAQRSRVSKPTVVRILTSNYTQASFGNVSAIADTLGMVVSFTATAPADEFCTAEARRKARQLTGLVQGTAGLEAQAVDAEQAEQLTQRTLHQLLAGSRRRLWKS